MRKRMRGLTLVELMVVIAIVAVLATIAIVAWGNLVRRAARSEAISALEGLAVRQEQYRLANPFFADSLTADFDPDIPATTPNGKYAIAILEGAGTANFTATATPQGSQADDNCGTFAINQDGPITDDASYADGGCWKR